MIASSVLLTTFVCCIIAFLLCGIPFGLIIASVAGHVDIRSVGSGNIGTTNVGREVGKGAAAATLACDAGKGFVSTFLAAYLIGAYGAGGAMAMVQPTGAWGWTLSAVYLCCICGHIFSPFLGFHGGKGIAVGFGAALGFMWPVAIGMLVVFLLVALPTRYVSLASISAAFALPLLGLFIYHPEPSFLLPLVIVACIVIWAHRSNIRKLRNHEEKRFSFHHASEKA